MTKFYRGWPGELERGRESALLGAAADAGKKKAKKEPEQKLSEQEQEALNDIASRFSGLELD